MRIVVPISRSDLHLLPSWVELHQKLKCGMAHELHMVVPQPLEGEAQDAKVSLTGFFESITIHVMDFEPMGGWPYAPNSHFWACANFMYHHNRVIPWQLVELDCRPIRQHAYDLVAAKYSSCGVPFFGNVSKTPWRSDDGRITKSLYGDKDIMMSGCAVYPGNLIELPNCAGLMQDFMKGTDSTDEAWDMHLRAAMQNDGMAHTELIGNYWNTENYRIEAGRLACDSRMTHEIFAKHPEWEIRKCGGFVHPDSVMIHGCKDESLTNLVLSDGIPDFFAGPVPVSAPVVAPTPAPESQDRIAQLEAMVRSMQELISQKNTAAPVAPVSETPKVAPTETYAVPPLAGNAAPSIEEILQALPAAPKKIKLSELSKNLKADSKIIEGIIVMHSDKFIAPSGPAKWVGRAA